jgi:hypothetical protein
VIAADSRGAAIRLDADDLVLASPATIASDLAQLLTDLGVSEGTCDLVVDAGLTRDTIASRVATAEAALAATPALGAWRNVIVAFSAFPESLTDVAKGTVTQFVREDALAFQALLGRGLPREVVFSDYGVGVPFYSDAAWAPIPGIRYTVDGYWMVHRGMSKLNPSPQYQQLAANVVAAGTFAGAAFSAGDQYLDAVAGGHAGPGSAMTYLRAAMSHHVACVLHRLATLGVP